MNSLVINGDSVLARAFELGAKEKEIQPALRRAVQRTARWIMGALKRQAAKEVKIVARVLNGRIRLFVEADKARVFFGMDPIELARLNPRKTNWGMQAGPVKVVQGFFIPNAKGNVFTRIGQGRLPIQKAEGLHIEKESEKALQSLLSEIEPRIWKEFERELNWQRVKESRGK